MINMEKIIIKNSDEKRDRQRKAARKYYYSEKGKIAHRRKNAEYFERNKEKKKARFKIAYLIRTGQVIPGKCEVVGCPKNTEPHHDDYSQPLKVRWLCRDHHLELHFKRI